MTTTNINKIIYRQLIGKSLYFLLLVPVLSFGQNSPRYQSNDSINITFDSAANQNNPNTFVKNPNWKVDFTKDPNFPVGRDGYGDNKMFTYDIGPTGKIGIRYKQPFAHKGSSQPKYLGYDANGITYIQSPTNPPETYAFSIKKPDELKVVTSVPSNLLPNRDQVIAQPNVRHRDGEVVPNPTPVTDDGLTDVSIVKSKAAGFYTLTLTDNSTHKVSRFIPKGQGADVMKAFEALPMNSGAFVPTTGDKVKIYTFEDSTGSDKGKVSVDDTVTKAMFNMIFSTGK